MSWPKNTPDSVLEITFGNLKQSVINTAKRVSLKADGYSEEAREVDVGN